MRLAHEQFRILAWKQGLAATHRRPVVPDTVLAHQGHYSPEPIHAGKVTPRASTLRVDGNLKPHHHPLRSPSLQDMEVEFIDCQRLSPHIPDGFDLTHPVVEVFRLCPAEK